jgi:hypothetical protein
MPMAHLISAGPEDISIIIEHEPQHFFNPIDNSFHTHHHHEQDWDEWNEPSQETMDDPIRINVDVGCPENNGIFDITWITHKIIHGYAKNVICVQVDVCSGNQNKLQMSVPSGAE